MADRTDSTHPKTSYAEKLRDPRWQKKRLRILERDEWTCQQCYDQESTLHVHHLWYQGEPWDAPDQALVTLCSECHEEESASRPAAEQNAVRYLRRLLAGDLTDIPYCLGYADSVGLNGPQLLSAALQRIWCMAHDRENGVVPNE